MEDQAITPAKPAVVVVGTHDLEALVFRRQLETAVDIVAFVADPRRAPAVIREQRPAIVLMFMDHERDAVLALSRQLATENLPIIMVSRDRDPNTILLAMRSNARDFAYLEGEDNDLLRAVTAMATAPTPTAGRRGTVIAVFGCKGGCGATTIATNLAGALLEGDPQRRVVICDLDTHLGDVLTFLDLAPRYTWADLVGNLHRLDDDLVQRTLPAHASGLRVVSQGGELERVDGIDATAVTRTIGFLRQHYDFIVLDGLRDFSELALAALDAADRVAVTLTQDVPALKNASRCLEVFRKLGYPAPKLKLILNRHHKREKLDLDTIGDALGVAIAGTVSNDFPTVVRAINEGTLLVESAPHAHVTEDVRELLPALELAPRAAKRAWFRRHR